MERYAEPLLVALVFFPIVAAFFTLPYVIYCYRKYGSVLMMRVVCVYAFIYYLMSVYCLAVLPFPEAGSTPTQSTGLNLIPFSYVPEILTKSVNLSITNPKTWMPAFFSSGIYEPLLNILMFLPLGVFLRYYFGWSRRKTVLCAFLLSLFLEVTQYTATYGLAPYRYRLADVNDLIDNTLGGFLGYLITPWLTSMLPSRERLNQVSYERGARVSYIRRLLAYFIDGILMIFITLPLFFIQTHSLSMLANCVLALAYYGLIPYLWKGQTPGKALVRIRMLDATTHEPAALWQYAARAAFLHVLVHPDMVLAVFGIDSMLADLCEPVIQLLLMILAIHHSLHNVPQMFYEKWTNTVQVSTANPPMATDGVAHEKNAGAEG